MCGKYVFSPEGHNSFVFQYVYSKLDPNLITLVVLFFRFIQSSSMRVNFNFALYNAKIIALYQPLSPGLATPITHHDAMQNRLLFYSV